MIVITVLGGIIAGAIPAIMAQSSGTDLVANLLTGGGFVFLAAIMGGLALWNKNQSESIVSINKASQEFVEGARTEVASARADSLAARADAHKARLQASAAQHDLEESQESARLERDRFRRWIHKCLQKQELANEAHNRWDGELKTELERLGGSIRDAPPLSTFSPDDPDYPLR